MNMNKIIDLYKGCNIANDIDAIKTFRFEVNYSELLILDQPDAQKLIFTELSQFLANFLNESKLYHHDKVETKFEDGKLIVLYNDDIYHCQFWMGKNSFTFARVDSSLQEFELFLNKFNDFIPNLFTHIKIFISERLNFNVIPSSCSYAFDFTFSQFKLLGTRGRDSVKNYDIINKFFDLKSKQSPLVELNFKEPGRQDITVSGIKNFDGKPRRCWFTLQGFGNKNYSEIKALFSYQSDTYSDIDGNRFEFDMNSINELEIVINKFLKEIVFNKFLGKLFEGISFRSQRT